MPKLAKLINDKDNVVTALADMTAGEEVQFRSKGKETLYKCNQDIPFGHKIAIETIKKGDRVVKYGEPIGSATQDIQK